MSAKGPHFCLRIYENQTYCPEIAGPLPDVGRGQCVHTRNKVGEGAKSG